MLILHVAFRDSTLCWNWLRQVWLVNACCESDRFLGIGCYLFTGAPAWIAFISPDFFLQYCCLWCLLDLLWDFIFSNIISFVLSNIPSILLLDSLEPFSWTFLLPFPHSYSRGATATHKPLVEGIIRTHDGTWIVQKLLVLCMRWYGRFRWGIAKGCTKSVNRRQSYRDQRIELSFSWNSNVSLTWEFGKEGFVTLPAAIFEDFQKGSRRVPWTQQTMRPWSPDGQSKRNVCCFSIKRLRAILGRSDIFSGLVLCVNASEKSFTSIQYG